MQFLHITHALCVAALSTGGQAPRPANADAPTVSTATRDRTLGDLERTEAWLLVELAEDDTDHQALAEDLAVVRHRIAQIRGPAPRPRPRLRAVS